MDSLHFQMTAGAATAHLEIVAIPPNELCINSHANVSVDLCNKAAQAAANQLTSAGLY